MTKKIWLASPHMSEEGFEKKYIESAFESNWIAPLGENVDQFENEISKLVNIGYAAALVSGTAAIHMALKALNVGKGDFVICQSLTFSATANPIIYVDAKPIFIDSDFESWNMDPDLLNEALRKFGNRVKAVIVVHIYGLSAKLKEIKSICDAYGVPLIEDSAESLGTLYRGQYTGTFGDYGIYSFNGNKIITTSGGGMLISNNAHMISKVRYWSTQSRDTARHYQHSEVGFNYRMSNILAGIGRGQLKVLSDRIEKKREIFRIYKERLSHLSGLTFMPMNEWNEPNCWLSVIQLKGEVRPEQIMDLLEKNNIESRPVWKPMHQQPVFESCEYFGNGVSDQLFENGVCLPSDTKMTLEDQERVCSIIESMWSSTFPRENYDF